MATGIQNIMIVRFLYEKTSRNSRHLGGLFDDFTTPMHYSCEMKFLMQFLCRHGGVSEETQNQIESLNTNLDLKEEREA